jgi:hypothetical protein
MWQTLRALDERQFLLQARHRAAELSGDTHSTQHYRALLDDTHRRIRALRELLLNPQLPLLDVSAR